MALTKVRGAGAEGLTLSSTALTVANGLTLTDGNVTLASGHGIDFSATADSSGSMSSELLDFYEEGSFTPVLADANSGGNTASMGIAKGEYTRIGKLTYVTIVASNIDTSGMTGGNTLHIRGLPFAGITSSGISQQFVIRADDLNVGSTCFGLVAVLSSGISYLVLKENRDGAADTNFAVSGIESSGSDLFITGCYVTD